MPQPGGAATTVTGPAAPASSSANSRSRANMISGGGGAATFDPNKGTPLCSGSLNEPRPINKLSWRRCSRIRPTPGTTNESCHDTVGATAEAMPYMASRQTRPNLASRSSYCARVAAIVCGLRRGPGRFAFGFTARS
ncbi:hypothetical protein Pa4123_21650 [Phytohabitans aurantiacus]|uniref:Uncharacterized protein n=1 Tax=Phytohabitans aurantiacus TaxID=3016789 RepID=A0ABQ5QTD4_9ACTN|nr:hypothetical protein Pa4123_21650 [Phytohabitans aurantiacus]